MKKRKFMKNQSKKQQSENEVPEEFRCSCCGRDVRKPYTTEEIIELARDLGIPEDSYVFDSLRQSN